MCHVFPMFLSLVLLLALSDYHLNIHFRDDWMIAVCLTQVVALHFPHVQYCIRTRRFPEQA